MRVNNIDNILHLEYECTVHIKFVTFSVIKDDTRCVLKKNRLYYTVYCTSSESVFPIPVTFFFKRCWMKKIITKFDEDICYMLV